MKIRFTQSLASVQRLVGAAILLAAQQALCAPVLPASISELQLRMAAGQLSSEELVVQALAAVERQAFLNAFISIDGEAALQQARRLDQMRRQGKVLGPLHGIPIAIKDNIHVAGLPNTAGTPLFKSFVPSEDASAVARLKAAGAVVLGKTNMHELAYGITSGNAAFGEVGNARDRRFIAGGSSGGTAVAVASGMAIAGLGTDTGGSSRIPAALNGIVGFRPTTNRYPSDGFTRISHTRDTIGPMARTVADVALLDRLIAGESDPLPVVDLRGARLGVPREYFYEGLEPAISRLMDQLLAQLADAGVELIHADLDEIGALNQKTGFPIVIFETGPLLQKYLDSYLPGQTLQALANSIASPDVRDIMAMVVNEETSESSYRQAIEHYRPEMQRAYAAYFERQRAQAILFPTTPLTARRKKDTSDVVELNGRWVPTFATYIRNTDPGSNAGIPGLTIPLPTAAGDLPVGVEIDGPEGSDRRLLAIGAAIERLIGQHNAARGPMRQEKENQYAR